LVLIEHMTIIVVGSTGQLARHLQQLLPEASFLSRADADLANPATLGETVQRLNPSVIINAAAYTAVDRAEKEAALAWRVNAEAPAVLARLARDRDIPLVQVSTDYVFDGLKADGYIETDLVGPLSVYGATKLGGELAVRAICTKHWIVRTSWVFSEFGTNFVKTMLRIGNERDELKVVVDQRGRPTYAGDLAKLIVGLFEPGTLQPRVPYGTYHAAGGPVVSWHQFATRIMDRAVHMGLLAKHPVVHAIPTSEYPTPAKRPINSVLQPNPALDAAAKLDWEAGLDSALAKLR
jgi:dTDP-4-dehydrorhamnose reductase